MKVFKGCVNEKCEAYKKKHYRDDYEYCPFCGDKLEYVCADCWKVMEDNSEKHCESCKAKREQQHAQNIEKAKGYGVAAVGVAGAVGKAAWNHKDDIVKAAKVAVKIVKK